MRGSATGPPRVCGLENPSANNCFLNVVVQSLWHLDSFRVLLDTMTPPMVDDDTSSSKLSGETSSRYAVNNALHRLFLEFQFSDSRVLPPADLRNALASIDPMEFNLGEMADAAEALDRILDVLPTKLQTLFKYTIFDQRKCDHCSATSDPELSSSHIYRACIGDFDARGSLALGSALHAMLNQEDSSTLRSCPGEVECGKHGSVLTRHCLQLPRVFAVQLIWPAEPTRELKQLGMRIATENSDTLDVESIFATVSQSSSCGSADGSKPFKFRGMICYYGRHYVAFFPPNERIPNAQWLLFDDAKIHQCGTTEQLVEKYAGIYQPTLLLYERVGPMDGVAAAAAAGSGDGGGGGSSTSATAATAAFDPLPTAPVPQMAGSSSPLPSPQHGDGVDLDAAMEVEPEVEYGHTKLPKCQLWRCVRPGGFETRRTRNFYDEGTNTGLVIECGQVVYIVKETVCFLLPGRHEDESSSCPFLALELAGDAGFIFDHHPSVTDCVFFINDGDHEKEGSVIEGTVIEGGADGVATGSSGSASASQTSLGSIARSTLQGIAFGILPRPKWLGGGKGKK